MQTNRSFRPTERYEFDYVKCTTANGWAQCDTAQDASYFGIWASPFELKIYTYAEGDHIEITCENEAQFIAQINEMVEFHNTNDTFKGIDPGFNKKLKQKFIDLGLTAYLH